MNPNETSVTGVLVTGKTSARYPLAMKAVEAWQNQNYPGERVLMVINDHPDVPLFADGECPEGVIEYRIGLPEDQPVKGKRKYTLGELRNIGIVLAETDYIVQWDDDDYSHPDRLAYQVIQTSPGGCSIFRHEIHCNLKTGQAFVNDGQEIRCRGFPGTMLWPADSGVEFPCKGKAEDTEFILALREHIGVQILRNDACMYFRCYHGHNTWSEKHVMKRKSGARNLDDVERAYVDNMLKTTYADIVENLRAQAG